MHCMQYYIKAAIFLNFLNCDTPKDTKGGRRSGCNIFYLFCFGTSLFCIIIKFLNLERAKGGRNGRVPRHRSSVPSYCITPSRVHL